MNLRYLPGTYVALRLGMRRDQLLMASEGR